MLTHALVYHRAAGGAAPDGAARHSGVVPKWQIRRVPAPGAWSHTQCITRTCMPASVPTAQPCAALTLLHLACFGSVLGNFNVSSTSRRAERHRYGHHVHHTVCDFLVISCAGPGAGRPAAALCGAEAAVEERQGRPAADAGPGLGAAHRHPGPRHQVESTNTLLPIASVTGHPVRHPGPRHQVDLTNVVDWTACWASWTPPLCGVCGHV